MSQLSPENSKGAAPAVRWGANIAGTLAILFLILDGVTKLWKPIYVVQAFAREGIPIALAPGIGTLLLILVAVYVVPRSRAIGAILLTGYLGGAVAVNLRAGDPPFEVVFPILVGCLVWLPVYALSERFRKALA